MLRFTISFIIHYREKNCIVRLVEKNIEKKPSFDMYEFVLLINVTRLTEDSMQGLNWRLRLFINMYFTVIPLPFIYTKRVIR